jgi:carbonic anhydrase
VTGPFDEFLRANEDYAQDFRLSGLDPRAARGLAVLTCFDSRIEPLQLLGLRPGEAKILRNAGGRVTDDVRRSLVLAADLLGVERVMVIAHTKCRLTAASDEAIRAEIHAAGAPDPGELEFLSTPDPTLSLRRDVEALASWPPLERVEVGGFLYDVDTGRLRQIC